MLVKKIELFVFVNEPFRVCQCHLDTVLYALFPIIYSSRQLKSCHLSVEEHLHLQTSLNCNDISQMPC